MSRAAVIRRVVTGHTPAGRSTVVDDGVAPRTHEFEHIPGMAVSLAWETRPGQRLATGVVDPTPDTRSVHPEPGASRLLIVRFPPDAVYAADGFDPVAADAENGRVIPGLAERFESEAPGMHRTETVDYAIVLDGRPALELDDGELTQLGPGDVVVQNGTRHAWRNPADEPARIAFVLIGAQREPESGPGRAQRPLARDSLDRST